MESAEWIFYAQNAVLKHLKEMDTHDTENKIIAALIVEDNFLSSFLRMTKKVKTNKSSTGYFVSLMKK